MENYALIARQEEQIKALKTENDYLKKVSPSTVVEKAKLCQRIDDLERENQTLQSENQVMTEKYNLQVGELESDLESAEYALIARQEEQIKALKTENDYLKKVKNPTEIKNAKLRERNDALALENQTLQSENQVMTEKHNLQVGELESDLESANWNIDSSRSRENKLIEKHKVNIYTIACVFVVVVLLVSVVTYNFGHRNALYDAFNYPQFQFGQVMNYLVEHQKSGEIIHPNTVSAYTGVRDDDVLLILLKLEKRGILTKSQFPGVDKQPLFQLE